MQVPNYVGVGEMAQMFGLSKSRMNQLVESAYFPAPYLRLQMGRIWDINLVIEWGGLHGRPMTFPTEAQRRSKTISHKRVSYTLAQGPGTQPRDGDPVEPSTAGDSSGVVQGTLFSIVAQDGCVATPLVRHHEGMCTISSRREELEETSGSEENSSTKDLLGGMGKGGLGGKPEGEPTSAEVAEPSSDPSPAPTRRETMLLDKEALADDWDLLADLWKRGATETLAEEELDLYPFAAMVILAEGVVPTYRRTKTAMVKAWKVVREVHETSQAELTDAVRALMERANQPWSPGAVKKFSANTIPQMRHKPVDAEGRTQPNRWQGSRQAHAEGIARMTEEQKRRWGVIT